MKKSPWIPLLAALAVAVVGAAVGFAVGNSSSDDDAAPAQTTELEAAAVDTEPAEPESSPEPEADVEADAASANTAPTDLTPAEEKAAIREVLANSSEEARVRRIYLHEGDTGVQWAVACVDAGGSFVEGWPFVKREPGDEWKNENEGSYETISSSEWTELSNVPQDIYRALKRYVEDCAGNLEMQY